MKSIVWLPPLLSTQQIIAKANVEPSVENHFPGDQHLVLGKLITVDPPNKYSYSIFYCSPTQKVGILLIEVFLESHKLLIALKANF